MWQALPSFTILAFAGAERHGDGVHPAVGEDGMSEMKMQDDVEVDLFADELSDEALDRSRESALCPCHRPKCGTA